MSLSKNTVSILLTSISLCYSTGIFALDLLGIKEGWKNNPSFPKKPTYIEQESPDFDIDANIKSLLAGNMLIAAQKMHKQDFIDSPYKAWDIDKLSENMGPDDVISVVKAVAIIPNKRPDFFSMSTLVDETYFNTLYFDSTRNTISSKELGIVTIINTYLTTVVETVAQYQALKIRYKDAEEGPKLDISDEEMSDGHYYKSELAKIINNAPDKDQLTQIAGTYGRPRDVSLGLHGMRSASYYYALPNDSTLQVTYKVTCFKREPSYDWLTWKIIKGNMLENQMKATWEALKVNRKY